MDAITISIKEDIYIYEKAYDGKFKSFAELRGYSSLDITSRQISEIVDFVDLSKEIAHNNFNIVLDEGVLIAREYETNEKSTSLIELDATRYYIYFKIDPNEPNLKIHFEAYVYDSVNCSTTGMCAADAELKDKIKIDILNYTEDLKNEVLKKSLDDYRNKLSEKLCDRMLFILTYALLYVSIIQEDKNTVIKESKGLSYKSDGLKKSTKTHKIQLINNNRIAYVYTGSKERLNNSREYNRHLESWQVLGHLRHYKKSNKTVWINPYTKGNSKKEAKTYVVQ